MLEKPRWQLRQDETREFMLSLIIWLTRMLLRGGLMRTRLDAAWNIIGPPSYFYVR
jgi:hypothetical protein